MKTLKDLLRKPEVPVTGQETTILIESIRVPFGARSGDQEAPIELMQDIGANGLRHPITVWADGTLISGARRLRAVRASMAETIPAVFVDNIIDAGKRLLNDNSDEHLSVPMKPTELCRLWATLITLDEPAAAARLDEARRQGVKLRKLTQRGQRQPGRSTARGKGAEFLMTVLGEPFGMSEATASRLYAIHRLAHNDLADPDRRKRAADALAALDRGESSIWRCYADLFSGSKTATTGLRAAPAAEPAPAAKQRAAWDRALPQMEGLVAGLTELGPPHPDLDWATVGPVHARLMKIRRDLEKTINKMKETAQS